MRKICMVMLVLSIISCERKEPAKEPGNEKSETLEKSVAGDAPADDRTYVFNLDSFLYLKEFPETISGVKERYESEIFKETVAGTDSDGHLRSLGDFTYSLDSVNIRFTFYGNTEENAKLRLVRILTPLYQCPGIQVIGMSSSGLKELIGSSVKYEMEGVNFMITTDNWLYSIGINIENDVVVNYYIVENL